MKVNLIYDMRHQDESWFDKFSKADRGEAVLSVLSSARHKVEFEKIMESLESPKQKHKREVVRIDDLLSNFTQQKTYTLLKLNYKYVSYE